MDYIYNNSRIVGSVKFKKKNKIRKIIKNVILLTVIIIFISVSFNIILGKNELTTKKITVNSGNTLWNIASKICNKNENLNIQNVILQIKNLNNLNNSIIYEGQELLIYNY
ncbi:MAG: LysM peptidoglycan-binding domain-containing protein [Clostridia bacterium]